MATGSTCIFQESKRERKGVAFIWQNFLIPSLTDLVPLMGKPKPTPTVECFASHASQSGKMATVWILVELSLGSRALGESKMATVVRTQDNGDISQMPH